jgi:hypothetical protein
MRGLAKSLKTTVAPSPDGLSRRPPESPPKQPQHLVLILRFPLIFQIFFYMIGQLRLGMDFLSRIREELKKNNSDY